MILGFEFKGIATSLVYECERQVKEWYADDVSRRREEDEGRINGDIIYNSKNEMINNIVSNNDNISTTKTKNPMSNSVCLKVRESNVAAVQMYRKLGYVTVFEEIEDRKTNENILLMRKDLTSSSPPPSLVTELSSE